MAVSILIATSNAGFGELVSQILLETGDYDLSIAGNKAHVLAALEAKKPELLILETELKGTTTSEMVVEARALLPDLLLILIITEGGGVQTLEDEFKPNGTLLKPVYLPDLVSKVEEVLAKGKFKTTGRRCSGYQCRRAYRRTISAATVVERRQPGSSVSHQSVA